MHGEGFFFQAFVYLAAAVVAVPIAKRFGLGSVLGYLLAGMVIGPTGLGLIADFEELLVSEHQRALSTDDAAWDVTSLRDDMRRRAEHASGE